MILLARESRGLTQTQLSKNLPFSQSRLSKLEDNLLAATDEDVSAFSEALQYPRSFFYRRDIVLGAFNGLYRRRKSLGAKFLSQFNARVNIRTARIERLAQKDDIIKADLPHCDPDDYIGGPAEIAAHVRQYLGIPPGPIKNLIDFLENHGIVVVSENFGSPKIDGVSIFSRGGRPIIFLNSAQPKSRQIFTCVHEVGHMVMHRFPRPTEELEEEVDCFTAEFTMPAADIRPNFKTIRFLTLETLQSLKMRWNVSMAALLRRARDLRFIDERRYVYLNIQMSSRGFKRVEPLEEFIRIGSPSFEQEMIEFHRTDLKYSDAELCDLLDIDESEFLETYGDHGSSTGGLRVVK